MTATASALALVPVRTFAQFFGITPDLGLPPLYELPEAIVLLVFVGTAALGLAYLFEK